jgi:(2Fe-2S) ferredoxin
MPFIPRVSFDTVHALVKGYLLPTKLNPAHDGLSPIHRDRLLRSEDQQQFLHGVKDVTDVLVLICGHGGRDIRCGITGPILRDQFEKCLPDSGLQVLRGPVEIAQGGEEAALPSDGEAARTARVGLISHIGGHKFAGNVIVYIPPGTTTPGGQKHALEGCGIWYGRVEAKHVEGIVQETVLEGRVIEDLFRGGIKQGGEILRIESIGVGRTEKAA